LKIVSPFLRSVIYKELSLLYIYPDKAIFDEIKKSEKDFSAAFDELYSIIHSGSIPPNLSQNLQII